MTKSTITREQLLEIIETDHVQCGEASYLARMALAAMDGEPVAWLLSGGGTKNVVCFDSGNAYADPLREVTPLYRHPQPAPVVPEEMTIRDACKFVQDMRLFDDVSVIVMRTWNACRAAMLNHPSSIQPNTGAAPGAEIKHPSSNSQVIGIDPASGPDRTVEVRYVAPPGYVMVPKEPTSEMVKKMRYHVGGYDRNIKEGYKAMLAAAPQEVNHG